MDLLSGSQKRSTSNESITGLADALIRHITDESQRAAAFCEQVAMSSAALGKSWKQKRVTRKSGEAAMFSSMTTFRRISTVMTKKTKIFSVGLVNWGVHSWFINQRGPFKFRPKHVSSDVDSSQSGLSNPNLFFFKLNNIPFIINILPLTNVMI